MNRPSANSRRFFRRCLPFGIGLALGLPGGVRADQWTNAAGNAVEARWVSLEHGVVVFERPDGSRFDMSLASLSTATQQRVLSEAGDGTVPERLRSGYNLYVRTLKRLDELQRAGKIGTDELTKQSAVIRAQFEKTCVELDIPEARRDELIRRASIR